MRLLLVGGTGVLSSAVASEALKKGISVTMINRGNRKAVEGAEVIVCDCHKYGELLKRLEGQWFDAIIDFLCYSEGELVKSFEVYSRFTGQYIFISSCAVYAKGTPSLKQEHFPKPNKLWFYSIAKWNCEQRLAALAKVADCRWTVIRPAITYDNTRIPYGISPKYGFHWTLCARILSGKPIITWNGGKNVYNMLRVEDFAVGAVGLIGNEKAYGEAFNICGDQTPSFKEVLDEVASYVGKEAITVDVTPEFYARELPERAGEILGGRAKDATNSNAKIKSVVPAFRQTIFLKDGVKKTLDAYKAQNFQKGIDWNFDAQTDRIVAKWCRENGVSARKYNLEFVNYIGTATFRDRLHYMQIRYRGRIWTRVLGISARIVWNLARLICGNVCCQR